MNHGHQTLLTTLTTSGTLHSPTLIHAFTRIDRKDFVPPIFQDEAYENHPVPIGGGQTISQPETVAFMLELLAPQEGEHILDLGSGSGWTSALLGIVVGDRGRVVARERIPELVDRASRSLAPYALPIDLALAGAALGAPDLAPFDRILVSASAPTLPSTLITQLKPGGTLVIPVQEDILCITRTASGYTTERHPGFLFVPLLLPDQSRSSE